MFQVQLYVFVLSKSNMTHFYNPVCQKESDIFPKFDNNDDELYFPKFNWSDLETSQNDELEGFLQILSHSEYKLPDLSQTGLHALGLAFF